MHVNVSKRMRERERECVCVCARARARARVRACVRGCLLAYICMYIYGFQLLALTSSYLSGFYTTILVFSAY